MKLLMLVIVCSALVSACASPAAPTPAPVDNAALGKACTDAGGKYLALFNECENVSSATCTTMGGTYDECASACRHALEGVMCTAQCVPVCSVGPAGATQQPTAVATYGALSAAQRTAAAEKAAAALKSLSADQKAAIKATMEAAQAKAVAERNSGAAPAPMSASGPVPATQVPANQAPVIVDFFASAPSSSDRAQGVAYYLNYDTQNATRVEIAGYVMDNPVTGSWPVWGTDPNTVPMEWSLWAGNEVAYTTQWMQIDLDSNLGSAFQPVTVNNRNVTLSLVDPQYVDGDAMQLVVNGQYFGNFVMDGRTISFPLVLVGGQNTIQLICSSTGAVSNATVKATLTNVTSGNATQLSLTMQPGQSDQLIVTAP